MGKESNTTNSNFFRAFDEVYKIKKIKGITFNLTHKSVYCFLLNYQMMTGKVFPSYKHIQDNLGIGSDNTIKKYLYELENMGLLKAISRKGTSNIYELVTLEEFNALDTEEQQTRKQPNKNLHIAPIKTKIVEDTNKTKWEVHKQALITRNSKFNELKSGQQSHVMIRVNSCISDNMSLLQQVFDQAIAEMLYVPKEQHVKPVRNKERSDLLSSCGMLDDDFDENYYQPPKSYCDPSSKKRDDDPFGPNASSLGLDYEDPNIPF